MIEWIIDFLSKNQFASGGVTVVVASSLAYFCRSIPIHIFRIIRRHTIYVVEINNTDDIYYLFYQWLSSIIPEKKYKRVTAVTSFDRNIDQKKLDKAHTSFVPAPGTHYIKIQGMRCLLFRERQQLEKSNMLEGLIRPYESFTISTAFWNRKKINSILKAIKEESKQDINTIEIYTGSYDYLIEIGKAPKRKLTSIFLQDNLQDKVYKDIQTFLDNKAWYLKCGIPYKRGYLLHGPPGCGKTSLTLAIASELNRDICVLCLNSVQSDRNLLILCGAAAREGHIIVIEDIDCIFNGRDKANDKDKVTFSGLLNAIDGVISNMGQIIFMTTNHKDKLDSALVRPGRVDCDVLLDYADETQINQMYKYLLPQKSIEDLHQFKKQLPTRNISPAEIQMKIIHEKTK